MTANIRGICRQSASMYEPMPARMRAFFVCAEPVIFTCLFHVGAAALLALTGSASRTAWYPHKRESLDRAAVRHNEECDGTHAHRPETRVFQRRPTQSGDRKSTRLNSSHDQISYAVF